MENFSQGASLSTPRSNYMEDYWDNRQKPDWSSERIIDSCWHWSKVTRSPPARIRHYPSFPVYTGGRYTAAKQSLTVITSLCIGPLCSAKPLGAKAEQCSSINKPLREWLAKESHFGWRALQPAALLAHRHSLFVGLHNVVIEILVPFDHVQRDNEIHIHIGVAQLVESDVHHEEVVPHVLSP